MTTMAAVCGVIACRPLMMYCLRAPNRTRERPYGTPAEITASSAARAHTATGPRESAVGRPRRNHVAPGPEREYLNGVRVVYRQHARAPPVQVVARPGHEQDGTRRYQQPVLDHAHVGDLLPEQEGHRAGDEVPDSRRA